jgi:hypothetical protein
MKKFAVLLTIRVRRIDSGKDQLLPHLRTLPHLH